MLSKQLSNAPVMRLILSFGFCIIRYYNAFEIMLFYTAPNTAWLCGFGVHYRQLLKQFTLSLWNVSKYGVFSGLYISPYSVRMRENTDQKKHFSRSAFVMKNDLYSVNLCLWSSSYRSSHQRCSVRKGVFRNFAKFTGKHRWHRILCKFLRTTFL